MSIDFSDAGDQRGELIPDGMIVPVVIKIRGDSLDGRKRANTGTMGVDVEMTVSAGPYTKRKLYAFLTQDPDRQDATGISDSTIKAILCAARGAKLDDKAAVKAVCSIENYLELDGMQVQVRVGVEPAKGEYSAKNKLVHVITPDRKEWIQLEQPARSATPSSSAAAPSAPAKITKPAWADKKKKDD
jgi:hypothetical protein